MNKTSYLYILCFMIFSCQDTNSFISNKVGNWDLDYKINLSRTDSGIYKTRSSINWVPYEG